MSEHKRFELTPAASILVAGVIIAGAIVFTNTRAASTLVAAGNQQAPTTSTNVPAPSAGEHRIGSPTAPVVLIEYADLECYYCGAAHPTLKRIVQESNGSVAWIFRHFPLESIHPQAKPSAIASECIAEQLGDDGFWKFADAMFANQKKMSPQYYEEVAVTIGADSAKFKTCVASGKYDSKIAAEAQDAMKNGGQGTPYTILFSTKGQTGVSGALPYEMFTSVIKAFSERQ